MTFVTSVFGQIYSTGIPAYARQSAKVIYSSVYRIFGFRHSSFASVIETDIIQSVWISFPSQAPWPEIFVEPRREWWAEIMLETAFQDRAFQIQR